MPTRGHAMAREACETQLQYITKKKVVKLFVIGILPFIDVVLR
jgi:hypothetical protein